MNSGSPLILTVNGGSSSIKFALFQAGGSSPLLRGAMERIGQLGSSLRSQGADDSEAVTRPLEAKNHRAAARALVEFIGERTRAEAPEAVGHRIVHGGPRYWNPEEISEEMIAELRRLSPLDPEHLPGEVALIEAFREALPHARQAACFDTAFHHDLPRVARLLPIPRRYEAQGVRKYGFHGLSYEYLMEELGSIAGSRAAGGRVILAHLGNGASMAAVHEGKPVDTSMSFTPTAGLVMGARSGDLDPGLFHYFTESEGMTPQEFNHMVNHESGMLGISETSSDIRDLLAADGDARAREAVELFCYQARKWIGSFAAALGGLDILVFSGGIGENAPVIRQQICQDLGFLGINIDHKRNAEGAQVISAEGGRVQVRVIPTNEELMIARSVANLLNLVAR